MDQTKSKRYSTEQMREYMRARYAKNKELGANISKINYYKRQGTLTKEDIQKYGEYAAYIIKAKKALDYLKEHNQHYLEDFLFNYLEHLEPENI